MRSEKLEPESISAFKKLGEGKKTKRIVAEKGLISEREFFFTFEEVYMRRIKN